MTNEKVTELRRTAEALRKGDMAMHTAESRMFARLYDVVADLVEASGNKAGRPAGLRRGTTKR